MAESHETGDLLVTASNPITDVLGAPLGADWTVEGLAEQVLDAIAAQGSEESQEFVLDADATTDRQSRRLLRPLLACLATKSAAEAGTPAELYGGHFSFQRPGPNGPVWIVGDFENRSGNVHVTLRRCTSPPPSERNATLSRKSPAEESESAANKGHTKADKHDKAQKPQVESDTLPRRTSR